MGRKSRPRGIRGGWSHWCGDQTQPRPADRVGVFREQPKFSKLLGASGKGGAARSPLESRSEISRHAAAVLRSFLMGGRGDDREAVARCGTAGVAGGALFLSSHQCVVLPRSEERRVGKECV